MAETLNSQQKETLIKFRDELRTEGIVGESDSWGTDDDCLIRFLRARKFNIKAAKTMFKKCSEWRRTIGGVGIDQLYTEIDPWDYPERKEVFKKWPIWFHKTDKKGRPINIQTLGEIDIPGLHKAVKPERHWHTIVVNQEALTREVIPCCTKRFGQSISGALCILDLKGFGQFWGMKGIARESLQLTQDYYPETMGQLLILNAPTSFTAIWSVIKTWIAKETADKIDILGSDYQEILLKHVDADNLPSSLGGNCKCEGGCEWSNAGPWLKGRQHRRKLLYTGDMVPARTETEYILKHQDFGEESTSSDEEFFDAKS
ncbi:CRAL/TRIO domain-containing protein [Sistotremastrum suecicum HHB10207 ss-3]|uniref:CRAL/TRIO domain-containing protein n=1 Tax=Sistotremastrum suecicum HHB10207 ss-3 TaxID=1314776 RepID=A0A166FFW6_9AGAM|nr:CRAL/TRIO domain-containing protein [Sistotremastrum suecicum HHB10207 ss-3]